MKGEREPRRSAANHNPLCGIVCRFASSLLRGESGDNLAATASQNPRYEAYESPPFLASLGFGAQFSLIASATLLVTPVVVANASGRGDLLSVVDGLRLSGGLRRVHAVADAAVGAGAVLPMFTAAFSIPFCINAVVDGGPATLTTLVLFSAAAQLVISRWLFILRRLVTPTVGGTVMMILSITLASVVPRLWRAYRWPSRWERL